MAWFNGERIRFESRTPVFSISSSFTGATYLGKSLSHPELQFPMYSDCDNNMNASQSS